MMYGQKQKECKFVGRILAALTLGAVGFSTMGVAAAAEDAAMEEFAIDEIVVTAERMPTKLMDTPANISVVTAEDIAANHYNNVPEALTHVNGVVVTNGASNADRTVRINGDERVVVLVDGRRINNDQGSMTRASVNLNMIPSMKNIARIEVVRGGGSALYGSDAVGGVINIITKKGKELRTTVDLSTGSGRTRSYEIANEGSDNGVSWFVTAGIERRDHFSYKTPTGENDSRVHSGYANNSFSLRLDKTIDAASSVRFDAEHRSIDAEIYNNSAHQEELFNNLSIAYNFKEDQATPGVFRIYDNYKHVDYLGVFHTRLTGMDYQNGWSLGDNHKLIVGAEWRESKSTNAPNGYVDQSIINKAIYLQDTWTFAPKWTLVPGVRMDNHSRFGTHWTPKVALNYNADDKAQVYVSWGRIFKAPTADDMYYFNPMWGGYYGDPNASPESGYTETLGFTYKFNPRTTLGVSVFQSEIHDAIEWVGVMPSRMTNLAYEKKRGVDISFQHKISDVWSYDVGYSYTHTEADYSGSREISARNMQPNGYRFGVHYTQGAWKANVMATTRSGLDESYFARRAYTLVDFNASYEAARNLTIYFKALNLTNQMYHEYPFQPTSWTKHYGQGRFFQVGVTYTF